MTFIQCSLKDCQAPVHNASWQTTFRRRATNAPWDARELRLRSLLGRRRTATGKREKSPLATDFYVSGTAFFLTPI